MRFPQLRGTFYGALKYQDGMLVTHRCPFLQFLARKLKAPVYAIHCVLRDTRPFSSKVKGIGCAGEMNNQFSTTCVCISLLLTLRWTWTC